jgi:hypothetical protein
MSTQLNQSAAVTAAKALAEKIVDTNPTIVDGACLVSLPDIGSTTGRIVLKDAETFVLGSKITSQAVRNGDLEVYPAKDLQAFGTIRVAAKRLLKAYSVEVGDMYLCPIAQLPTVIAELEELQLQYQVEVDLLSRRYDSEIEKHKSKNPDIALLIEKHRLAWGAFSKSFRYKMGAVLAVSPLLGDANQIAQDATNSLWDDVAADALDLHRKSFAGNESVSQRAVRPAQRIRDKLVNLSFLHSGIDQIIDQFDAVLNSLPKTGPVVGIDCLRLAHFLLGISTTDHLRMMAEDAYIITLPEPEPEPEEVIVEQTASVMEQPAANTTLVQEQIFNDSAWQQPAVSGVVDGLFESDLMSQTVPQVDVVTDGWGGF